MNKDTNHLCARGKRAIFISFAIILLIISASCGGGYEDPNTQTGQYDQGIFDGTILWTPGVTDRGQVCSKDITPTYVPSEEHRKGYCYTVDLNYYVQIVTSDFSYICGQEDRIVTLWSIPLGALDDGVIDLEDYTRAGYNQYGVGARLNPPFAGATAAAARLSADLQAEYPGPARYTSGVFVIHFEPELSPGPGRPFGVGFIVDYPLSRELQDLLVFYTLGIIHEASWRGDEQYRNLPLGPNCDNLMEVAEGTKTLGFFATESSRHYTPTPGTGAAVPVNPTPTTIAPQATSTSFTYSVQQGDTCVSIANTFDVSVQAIMLQNNLAATCPLFVGQELSIPFPTPTTEPSTAVLSGVVYPFASDATDCGTVEVYATEMNTRNWVHTTVNGWPCTYSLEVPAPGTYMISALDQSWMCGTVLTAEDMNRLNTTGCGLICEPAAIDVYPGDTLSDLNIPLYLTPDNWPRGLWCIFIPEEPSSSGLVQIELANLHCEPQDYYVDGQWVASVAANSTAYFETSAGNHVAQSCYQSTSSCGETASVYWPGATRQEIPRASSCDAPPNPIQLFIESISGCTATINGYIGGIQGPWYWEFGDNTYNTGWFPQSHSYPANGWYEVRVSTPNGEYTNSITVSIDNCK